MILLVIFSFFTMVSRCYELVFRFYKLASRYNELVSRYYGLVSPFNDGGLVICFGFNCPLRSILVYTEPLPERERR